MSETKAENCSRCDDGRTVCICTEAAVLSPSALAEGRRRYEAMFAVVNEPTDVYTPVQGAWLAWLFDHGYPILSAAERLSQVEGECAWTCDDEDTGEYWQTSCGQKFTFIDAGPKENGMKHCCYCGKRLVSR